MPTAASLQALDGLRDLTTLQWYVIPLLAIVIYIYAVEIGKARDTGNWDAVIAGLTLFGMDFINETWNGWVLHFTQHSAMWTAPGPTALRTMVGWNIEIMFMFAIAGIVFYHSYRDDPQRRIMGLPEKWAVAVGYAAFAVFVETLLNKGGLLIWEYEYWNRSFKGVWLIFFFGYFHFYAAVILVLALKRMTARLMAVGSLYAVAIAANVFALGIMGWRY